MKRVNLILAFSCVSAAVLGCQTRRSEEAAAAHQPLNASPSPIQQGTAKAPEGEPPPPKANSSAAPAPPAPPPVGPLTPLRHVLVIALENRDESKIIGNLEDAPYFNSLLKKGASAANFKDPLPLSVPSEPHYVWMEAGTNAFQDHTFRDNSPPSAANSTATTEHLSTQLDRAKLTWMSYQEGIDETTGPCPIEPSGFYQPKHNPFIFFRDVSGNPPSKTNARCAEHHRPIEALTKDLTQSVAAYAFITPNQCHDMHGQPGCPDSNAVKAGDQWLSQHLPPLIDYVNKNAGVIFLVFDEGEDTPQMPFLALGPTIKANYVSQVEYTHSSLLKSVEKILGVPVLPTVQAANDFSDLFSSRPY